MHPTVSEQKILQGFGWTEEKPNCPSEVGPRWHYYSWQGAANSLPVDPDIQVRCEGDLFSSSRWTIIFGLFKVQGVFFTGPPLKKLKYGKPRLGEARTS